MKTLFLLKHESPCTSISRPRRCSIVAALVLPHGPTRYHATAYRPVSNKAFGDSHYLTMLAGEPRRTESWRGTGTVIVESARYGSLQAREDSQPT
jgi:hypothetical protein